MALMQRLQRGWYWHSASPALRNLWRASPNRVNAAQGQRWLAVDLETTALEVAWGEVVSIAWAPVDSGAVSLAGLQQYLLRPSTSVGDSATFHQLRDCDLATGKHWDEVLPAFFAAARGRVLVFHGAQLDLAFLNRACRTLMGAPLLLPFVDTLRREQQRLQRRGGVIGAGELRLGACRRRYHLPDYPPHSAVVDALATAELFLAQQAQ